MSTVFPSERGDGVPLEFKEIVFSQGAIATRVQELARKIARDYHHHDLLVVGILKGAVIFASDLVRHIPLNLSLDFIAISPYSQQQKGDEVRILKDLEEDISGKHVLLIEDSVDTGLTLNYLVRILRSRDPASLAICTLLNRSDLRLVKIPIRYVGFHVNQPFLIGYGLDFRGCYRSLPYIATVNVPVSANRADTESPTTDSG